MGTEDMNIARRDKLLQVRTNALTAEHVYSVKLQFLGKLSSSLLVASLITPIVILLAQVPANGTDFEPFVQTLSYISSGALLILAVISLTLRVESRKESFQLARAANTFIASESQELIDSPTQDAAWFFRFVANQDSIDQKNISKIDDGLRKEAYRESLKRLVAGDSTVNCPVCNLSPYKFKPGICQLCGNGP